MFLLYKNKKKHKERFFQLCMSRYHSTLLAKCCRRADAIALHVLAQRRHSKGATRRRQMRHRNHRGTNK